MCKEICMHGSLGGSLCEQDPILSDLAEAEAELVAGYNMCGERSIAVIFNEENVEVSYVTRDSIHLLIRLFWRTIRKANKDLDCDHHPTCFGLDTVKGNLSNCQYSVKDLFSLKRYSRRELRMQ